MEQLRSAIFIIPHFGVVSRANFGGELTRMGECGIIRDVAGPPGWEEVNVVDMMSTFLTSVLASVVGYYICKWVDRRP